MVMTGAKRWFLWFDSTPLAKIMIKMTTTSNTVLIMVFTIILVLFPIFEWPQYFARESYSDLAVVLISGVFALRLFGVHIYEKPNKRKNY